jgi:hypothetical protein
LEAEYIEIQGCYYGNKHDILSVLKSVAGYQMYVHIKACLARRYIPRAWGHAKMTFIPAHGKVNFTQAQAYCPFSLLSFLQKTMQKLVTRNIKDETLGHVPFIYNNLPTNQTIPKKLQCTM